ncbi:MAG: M50 family metallopeptidase [Oscillospiraceae bacterium]|nr:M50 family metallopeptidase [Oscillospiraceae bacterium]
MYIFMAIIAFSALIAVHEAGHFTAAKLLGVRVNEFAIGMGPKLLKKKGKETLYTLRALPFGGFCAMGEDDGDTEDPRAFPAQKRWRRVVILAAGATANFIVAFIIIVAQTFSADSFVDTTITELVDGFPNQGEYGLMIGDTLMSINGEKLYYRDDFILFMGLAERRDDKEVDLVIRRGADTIKLDRYPLEQREYTVDGEQVFRYGITLNEIEATTFEKLKYSCYTAMNYVRLIRVSIAQLITGSAGIQDLSGPVGIVNAMNDIGQASRTVGEAVSNIVGFVALIGVNLAVMNMLPIPALDGGRILFVFISWLAQKILRRRPDPKYEKYIHAATFVLLMGLMVYVLVNDVVKIIYG